MMTESPASGLEKTDGPSESEAKSSTRSCPIKPSLIYDSVGHRYFDGGVQVPSLSKVMELGGYKSDLSKIPLHILQRKRALGGAVHEAISLYLHNRLDWTTVDSAVYPYVAAAVRYIENEDVEVEWSELPFGGVDVGFACTPDLLTKRAIREWKTTYKIMPDVAIQLAGQAVAVGDLSLERIVVQLKPNGDYDTVQYDDPEDIVDFQACLRTAKRKIRENWAGK
jgi:hypothetical protein